MSETSEAEKQSKPWQWPGEWMRDEKFWRDVGSRTIAGFIVVILGYFSAIGLGYVQQPNYRRLTVVAIAVVFALIMIAYGIRTTLNQDKKFISNIVKFVGAGAISLALVGVAAYIP
ncbi:multisubunit Na+/H+ antiporter MnhB subunit [Arthrobacter sp. V1I9]|uniref:hypothetical protein n=1 Tax=Arthrobacter sp. V1I9 TaxID=3042275 RepID=UPI0027910567|nr:hypothetical protein [Arthrobacter sp. V1I9]MDQ0869008.1 multisubunit Na+/H+ antiporter MnhB subunit [Arthrobacter sp. V1I9]